MTANTQPGLLTPAIVSAVVQMTPDELTRLQALIREHLRSANWLKSDNVNVISVRLSMETYEKLREIAHENGKNRSDVMREAVETFCRCSKSL